MMNILNEIEKIETTLAEKEIEHRHLFYFADISRQTWTNWKTGKSTPTIATWNRIESAYNRLRYEAHTSDE